MSNVGKWEPWFAGLIDPQPFAETPTYALGAAFLADCDQVEDWGCGKGWLRRFVPATTYRGIDGSWSPFADEIVDLVTYRSQVDGIFMRHVLEHNYDWSAILANAVASFRRRFALVVFTPFSERTRQIAFAADPGVPDISFARSDLTGHFSGLTWRSEDLETASQYGAETIFYVERV
jgi:hypothetical protein